MPSADIVRTPIAHARVLLPDDASSNLVNLRPLSPDGSGCKAVRWLGSGAATLWYVPVARRGAYTTSEASVPVPNARDAIRASFFAQGEERLIEASHLDVASTAGSWEVTF